MQQNKLVILIVAAVIAVLALGFAGYKMFGNSGDQIAEAAAQDQKTAPLSEADTAAKVLAAVGPLGDMELGSKDAPVTVIEYASLTCSHCAAFNAETYPQFKAKYIDTGKVHYIFREFPYDEFATSAFMLSRCAGKERYFGFVDVLFKKQAEWAFSENPLMGLLAIAKQGGFSEGTFNACMKNEQIFAHVRDVATKARNEFGVESTPTFFINGEKIEGALPFTTDDGKPSFEEALKRHLPADKQ